MRLVLIVMIFALGRTTAFAENSKDEEEANTFIMDLLDDPGETKTPPPAPAPARKVANKASEKFVGFKVVKSACTLHAAAESESAEAGKVKQGLKIWVESEGDNWFKVFRKAGEAYVAAECLGSVE